MAIGVANLLLVLSGESAGATAAIGETNAALGELDASASASEGILSGLGDIFLTAAKVLTALGLVTAVVSGKMAADFQQGTTRLITNAGETRDSVDNVIIPALLNLATQTGYATSQLIEGFRQVSSAGFKSADGVKVLAAATMGARAEQADLGTVLNVVTSILNAYNLPAEQAGHVTNVLIAAMQSGKLTLQDLSASLGTVIPAAANANVSLEEVTSAMATMANEGIKPAQASTYLRFTLLSLEQATPKTTKALADVGLTADEVRNTLVHQGLIAAITLLEQHVGEKYPAAGVAFAAEMAKVTAGTEDMDTAIAHLTASSPDATGALMNIVGGIRGAQGVLALGGAHLEGYAKMAAHVAKEAKDAGSSIIGWDQIQGNFNFQLSRAREVIEVTGIKLGQVLLPYITSAAEQFSNAAPMISAFADRLGTVFSVVAASIASFSHGAISQGTFNILWRILGVDPSTAAAISDTIQTVFQDIQKAAIQLAPSLEQMASAGAQVLPQVAQIAYDLSQLLGPALQFIIDNGNTLKPILIALAAGFALIKAVELGLAIQAWAVQFAAVATNIGKLPALMSAVGVSSGMQDALGWIGNFGKGALDAAGNFVSMTASAVAEGVKTAAAWTTSAASSAAGWASTKAQAVASFVATTVSAGVEAGKNLAIWLGVQGKIALGWLATQGKAIGSYVATAAAANPNSNAALLVWIGTQLKIGAGWVATGVKAAASFVATAASATVNAIASGLAWVASSATAVASFVATKVAAGVQAGLTLAANAGAAASSAAGWVASGIAAAASFVATTAVATAQTAIMIGRFLLAQAAILGVRAATLLWAGAQAILDIALDANPISLVIIAIAALVAGVIWAYQNVGWFRTAVNDVFDALVRFGNWINSTLNGLLDGIASKAQQVGSALNSINPFAQHSPSLVQNVEQGTKLIGDHYEAMADRIAACAKGARNELQALAATSVSGAIGDLRVAAQASTAVGVAGGAPSPLSSGTGSAAAAGIIVNVTNPSAQPYQIARELSWALKTAS